jgi:signal peptide peptidase SppA
MPDVVDEIRNDETEAPDMDFEAVMDLTDRTLSPIALVADEFVRTYMAREFIAAQNLAAGGRRGQPARSQDQIAIIPLHGVITPRGSLLARIFGLGGGLEQFRADLQAAMADDNVSSVILDVDSPGGTVDMVPETAAEILAARGNGKPILAISNTMAASAGYWIASAADELSVTPSGQVGSIGVFTVHEDISRMAESMGVKTTIISAGRFKTDGNPFEPLSKSAQQAMQTNVNDLYAMFVDSVAAGRGVPAQAVRAGYGEGRMVLAERAQMLGMVDRVETLDDMIARVGGTPVTADTAGDMAELDGPEANADGEPPTAVSGDRLPVRLYGEDRREQPAWLL